VVLAFLLIFMPETSRSIVGNGSIPNASWNQPLIYHLRKSSPAENCEKGHMEQTKTSKKARLSPWSSLKVFADAETCCLLLYGGVIYASSYVIVSTLPAQLQDLYGLDTTRISLCFLAAGFGTITSVLGTGRLLDWNFRRHAARLGVQISKQKQQDLHGFPIELARLQVSFPMLLLAGGSILAYGWTLQARTPLAVPLVFLFLESFGIASSFSGINNLLMDLNRLKPGTASAAMNLSRCWMGAGGVALGSFLSDRHGSGWMAVTIVGLWAVFSPLVLLVLKAGPGWRERGQPPKACEKSTSR